MTHRLSLIMPCPYLRAKIYKKGEHRLSCMSRDSIFRSCQFGLQAELQLYWVFSRFTAPRLPSRPTLLPVGQHPQGVGTTLGIVALEVLG